MAVQFALQVLNLLTEKEVKLVLPSKAIVPRTFVLKPGMVLFLGALGRIDYLQVRKEWVLYVLLIRSCIYFVNIYIK